LQKKLDVLGALVNACAKEIPPVTPENGMRKRFGMKGLKSAVFSGVILGITVSPLRAVTTDTINGTVTDSLSNLPVDSVAVSSGGSATTTKNDGTFSLILPVTQISWKAKPGQTPEVTWHSATGSFSWTGYSGAISIQVKNLMGSVVARYVSGNGNKNSRYSPAKLPTGMYFVEIKTSDRTDTYKLLNLTSMESTSTILMAQTTGGYSAAFSSSAATSAPYSLLFKKVMYVSSTVNVPAGTQKSLAVQLSLVDTIITLFDGKTLNGWHDSPANTWTVNAPDSSLEETGLYRGFLFTANKYFYYRVIYSVRQLNTTFAHWPCVLFFGTDTALDALGAPQIQLPYSWTWDYRPAYNSSDLIHFTILDTFPSLNRNAWAQCELLVNAATGTARSAVAQPPGTKAIEVVDFKDTTIPKVPSYFALQSHQAGIYDEYKDITIEVNPKVNDLITTK
jgi:hypothetical protein